MGDAFAWFAISNDWICIISWSALILAFNRNWSEGAIRGAILFFLYCSICRNFAFSSSSRVDFCWTELMKPVLPVVVVLIIFRLVCRVVSVLVGVVFRCWWWMDVSLVIDCSCWVAKINGAKQFWVHSIMARVTQHWFDSLNRLVIHGNNNLRYKKNEEGNKNEAHVLGTKVTLS